MLGSAGPPQLNLKRRPTGAPAGVSSSNLFSGWEHCGTPAGFVLRPRSPHWHISDARLGLRYRDRDRRGAPGKARPGPSHLLRRIDDSERVGKAQPRSRERLRLSHHESKRNISRPWATKTPGALAGGGAALKVTGLQRPTTTPLREITPEPFPYGMRRAAGAFIRSLESLVKGPRSVMTCNGQFNTNTDLFF